MIASRCPGLPCPTRCWRRSSRSPAGPKAAVAAPATARPARHRRAGPGHAGGRPRRCRQERAAELVDRRGPSARARSPGCRSPPTTPIAAASGARSSAALAKATGDDAVAALAVSPREPMRMGLVAPALADALEGAEQPVVLVLDDFHEVIDAVHEDLERLVRFPPPALRLVIVTRADPPIGLGRLRLDGSLTEIRAADLSFSLDEADALFRALGVVLAPEDLATLWRRTEGWAAALRLAAVSLQHHPDAARLHRALRRHRRHDQRLPGQRGAGPPATRAARLPAAHLDRRDAERRARRRADRGDGRPRDAGATGARRRAHDAARRARHLASIPPVVRRAPARRAARAAPRRGRGAAPAGRDMARRARRRRRRPAPRGRGRRLGARGRPHDDPLVPHDDQRRDGRAAARSSRRCRAELVEASPELALAFGGCAARARRPRRRPAVPAPRRGRRGARTAGAPGRSSPPAEPRWASTKAACAAIRRPRSGPPASCSSAGRRPGERRPEQRRAVLRPRPARHRRALDRRPRRGDRASRAGPCRRRSTDGNDWTALAASAHLAMARAFRGELAARAAPRRRGRRARPSAAAGRGRSRRAPPTACRRPSAIQRGQREEAERLVGPRPRRHCTTRASARCARCTPSIARCC